MKKTLTLILAALMATSVFASCAKTVPADDVPDVKNDQQEQVEDKKEDLIYAVEAGSAGEEAAVANGWKTNPVGAQSDALMEVSAGTSDAAIIDLLMAGAMIGEGTSYENLIYTEKLTNEEYGAGCRKGSDLVSFINEVLYKTYADGTMTEIAAQYGVQEALLKQPESAFTKAEADSDVAYIQDKGTLIVGITDFAPMDYKDDNGEWIGFDADMAKKVGEALGVQTQFIEIDWDTKELELDAKNIDVIWNGMTLTDGVKEAMDCTNAYCNNAQVVVIKK